MSREMRLIGLNREDRRNDPRSASFWQAVLGATLSVLLLALPLWALESVNDLAVDAVIRERVVDPGRPSWRGAEIDRSGSNMAGSHVAGRPQAMEPWQDPQDEPRRFSAEDAGD